MSNFSNPQRSRIQYLFDLDPRISKVLRDMPEQTNGESDKTISPSSGGKASEMIQVSEVIQASQIMFYF